MKTEFIDFKKTSAIKVVRETNEFFLIEKVRSLSSSGNNMYLLQLNILIAMDSTYGMKAVDNVKNLIFPFTERIKIRLI